MIRRDRYDSLFKFYAQEHRLDWLALKAQGIAESNLAPDAVSPAGAAGLMQFMLPTWVEWHGRETIAERDRAGARFEPGTLRRFPCGGMREWQLPLLHRREGDFSTPAERATSPSG